MNTITIKEFGKRKKLSVEEKEMKRLEQLEKMKDYNKKYYQNHKEDWNPKEKVKCECGAEVQNLTAHRKTRLHRDTMVRLSNVRGEGQQPCYVSLSRCRKVIGLGAGICTIQI